MVYENTLINFPHMRTRINHCNHKKTSHHKYIQDIQYYKMGTESDWQKASPLTRWRRSGDRRLVKDDAAGPQQPPTK